MGHPWTAAGAPVKTPRCVAERLAQQWARKLQATKSASAGSEANPTEKADSLPLFSSLGP